MSRARSQCNEEASIFSLSNSFFFSLCIILRDDITSSWLPYEFFEVNVEASCEYGLGRSKHSRLTKALLRYSFNILHSSFHKNHEVSIKLYFLRFAFRSFLSLLGSSSKLESTRTLSSVTLFRLCSRSFAIVLLKSCWNSFLGVG